MNVQQRTFMAGAAGFEPAIMGLVIGMRFALISSFNRN